MGDISRLIHGVVNLEQTKRIILLLGPAKLLTRPVIGCWTLSKAKDGRIRDQSAGDRRLRLCASCLTALYPTKSTRQSLS
jgi:hypothetical protein